MHGLTAWNLDKNSPNGQTDDLRVSSKRALAWKDFKRYQIVSVTSSKTRFDGGKVGRLPNVNKNTLLDIVKCSCGCQNYKSSLKAGLLAEWGLTARKWAITTAIFAGV
jgi:hypothetical protein